MLLDGYERATSKNRCSSIKTRGWWEARWQQREQSKRIHPEAYSASILPSDEENAPSVLPRWAPTGSLPGCSHAKWLQMRGMIRCWLRAKQNLPGNLATCSFRSLQKQITVTQLTSVLDFGQLFLQIDIFWQPESSFRNNFLSWPVFCSYCQVKTDDCWPLWAICWSRCSADGVISRVTVSVSAGTRRTVRAKVESLAD